MHQPRNHIEFRDSNPESPLHIAHTVLIDGNEVLVERGGIEINHSGDDPTRVTLHLLPHRVSFN